ncbi:hypothetical protein [Variovorax guangxiensis]|uniref:hypothetical protein n=1 Tax=Variovorax guangxiensis TaxID=1775474 RepID=UPI00285AC93F|nr:hypothetical protein [Variovorax guangxiensis]MDR6854255.1 hypothetical protein [Variovorax guangxiensis]
MGMSLDWIQWPAFAASVAAAYLVASNVRARRNAGFWIFLLSNVLWVAWGIPAGAWALIALQLCLAVLNIRGLFKTES